MVGAVAAAFALFVVTDAAYSVPDTSVVGFVSGNIITTALNDADGCPFADVNVIAVAFSI